MYTSAAMGGLQLCLTTLLVLASFSPANNQAGVNKVETCFRQNQHCSLQNVTCVYNARIVILDEQQGFNDSTTTCFDGCSADCCQERNFSCIHKVSDETFSRTFSNCWNKTQCQYGPLQENRVFTGVSNCRNGSSVFGVLKYSCIKESSVRDFTDPTPAVGHLLMATFSPSSRAYPSCVSPGSTLECLLEKDQTDQSGGVPVYRVMLVMNHSTPGNCSKLHVTAGSYKSPDMPCIHSTEYKAVDNIYFQTQIFHVLQLNNVQNEAWAVVQSSHKLKMTCGKTRSSTTAAPPSSSPSTPPSSTRTSSQPDSASPIESGSRGEAITTPVIASLAVLSVLLATALAVAVCVILKQRRTPADDTYARTLPVPAEDRTYASLHSDPGPRHQVVSLEPLSGAQPVPGPARGDHSRAPQYENMSN